MDTPTHRALLRDLRAAPGHQGARRAHAAADAAQVRRRARRRAPAAGPAAGHRPGRAARRRHVHLGDTTPGRRGARRQRLRADRDRLDLDLPGRRAWRRSRPARPAPRCPGTSTTSSTTTGSRCRRASRATWCSPRRSRRWPGPCGTTRALPRAYFSRFPGRYATNDEAVARRRRAPVGARPRRRRDQRGGAPHLDDGDRGHRDRAPAGRRGRGGGGGRLDQGHRAGRLPHPARRRRPRRRSGRR